MSQMHVEVALERAKRRFGVEIELHQPRVPYRETIRREARAHGRYKKQTGGRGQFGDCHIVIDADRGERGLRVRRQDRRRRHPAELPPGCRQGDPGGDATTASSQARRSRACACELVDGSYHTVDSSEMAFKIAGSMAFKDAYMKADPVLLEPIMELEVTRSRRRRRRRERRSQLAPRTSAGDGAARRDDDDQGRGADGRAPHVRPVARRP